jgi:putative ABC transport system permease protein
MALPLSYHWRNLLVRRTTTALTVLVIAVVVGVFVWMVSFAGAIDRTMSVASDPRKLIVLKQGATSESNSALPVDEFNKLSQIDEIARDADGRPLISPEMLLQVSLPRLRDGGRTSANVAVRGVTEAAFAVHRRIRLTGRAFSLGEREVIVGRTAAEQFGGLQIGDVVDIGYGGVRGFRVVGYFTGDGGPMESEIWGHLPALMNASNRTMYSSASLLLKEVAEPDAVINQVTGPAIQLAAMSEADYWENQSRLMQVYRFVSFLLVGIMSLAAAFSIANSMFALVAGRVHEFAMMRTIGFSSGSILTGLMIEALMLALVGGAIGCAACAVWLTAVGHTKDMFGANTFTTLAFDIRMNPAVIAKAMALMAAVGVGGALVPAIRASRLAVVSALREA